MMGLIGAVFAGVPLRLAVDAFGWRGVMAGFAALTALLAVALWLFLRDDPAERGYASHFHQAAERQPRATRRSSPASPRCCPTATSG